MAEDQQMPPSGDRRNVDPALLNFMQSSLRDKEEAHLREHDQADKAREDRTAAQAKLDIERDRRVEARFTSLESSIDERFTSLEKKVEEGIRTSDAGVRTAMTAQQTAIDKAQEATMKQADASFVKIEGLSARLNEYMPAGEANNRFRELIKTVDELKLDMRAMLVQKTTVQEVKTERRGLGDSAAGWVAAAISFVVMMIFIATYLRR